MRAQLLVRLREKIKRVWQDVIGPNDHLGINVVRPAPFADADGDTLLADPGGGQSPRAMYAATGAFRSARNRSPWCNVTNMVCLLGTISILSCRCL